MVIRTEQLRAFSDAAASGFHERMVTHLRKCFPAECEALQESGVRDTIRHGIQQSARYGATAERDVCKYIDLMMLLGRDFDTRAGLPWAARILNDQVLQTPGARIDQLFTVAKAHPAG
jgi:hypothetical protein